MDFVSKLEFFAVKRDNKKDIISETPDFIGGFRRFRRRFFENGLN